MNMIDRAIELMQAENELTGEQMAQLERDEELCETCADIFIAQTVLSRQAMPQPDADAALRRFHQRQQTREVKRRRTLYLRLAASLAMAASIIAIVFFLRPKEPLPEAQQPQVVLAAEQAAVPTLSDAKGQTIPVTMTKKAGSPDAVIVIGHTSFQVDTQLFLNVPYGSSYCLPLPDGTMVYLHPGAKIAYPNRFTGHQREVQFAGEAYFQVAHDAERPFVVTTPQGDVRAYGTEFNVKTTSSDVTEVVLVEGRVGVMNKGGKELLMAPGQKCTISDRQCLLSAANTEPYESWRDGYFHFEETPLSDILSELGRYYNLSVVSYHPERLNVRMRYIIPRDRDAAFAIDMLNRMGKVTLSIDEGRIIAH